MGNPDHEQKSIRALKVHEKRQQLLKFSHDAARKLCYETNIEPEQLAQEALRKLAEAKDAGTLKLTLDSETDEVVLRLHPGTPSEAIVSPEKYLRAIVNNLF